MTKITALGAALALAVAGGGCSKKKNEKQNGKTPVAAADAGGSATGTGTGTGAGASTDTGTGAGMGTGGTHSATVEDIPDLKPVTECPKGLSGHDEGLKRTLPKDCSTIVEGEYYVDGMLVIEAGATLKFKDGATLVVGYHKPSKLVVKGTAALPVTFTSAGDKVPGAWNAVQLWQHANRSVIEGLVIEYGGADARYGALYLKAKDVVFTGSTIRHARERGVVIEGDAHAKAFTGNTFDQPGKVAMQLDPSEIGFLGTNTFGKTDVIEVNHGNVKDDARWIDPGVPYVVTGDIYVDGDPSANTVAIAGGAQLRFQPGAALYVGYYRRASLEIAGTAAAPVTFTTAGDKEPGSWKGIAIYGGHGAKATVAGAIIEFGGGEGAGLSVKDGASLSVTGSTFRGNKIGVALADEAKVKGFDSNTFSANAEAAIQLYPNAYGALGAANVYEQGQKIAVLGGSVSDAATWLPQTAATEFAADTYLDAALTISPGCTLTFNDGAALYVGYYKDGASLKAQGTADKPVKLRGVRDEEGVWNGIHLYAKSKASILEHLELRNTSEAGVVVDGGASARLAGVSCAKCRQGALSYECDAKVTAADITGTEGTPRGEIKPEGCQ